MKHKEEFITEEKVINTPAGGVLIGKDKDGQTIIPNDGSLGGFLIGRLHKDGGIKAINKGTGQPLEMQSNEVVITAPAVSDTTKREFEGKMMTNREILSKINSDGGGVSFADGGDIPAKIHTTDCEYKFGGKVVKDTDIAHSLGINSTLKKGKQQFSSGDTTYDVDAIYNAIKKGKLRLKTKEVETFPMKYPVYDKKYSETVKTDFRKPNGITVRTESGEEVLIDGNHRMNNAYLKGRKTMKTYYIENPKQIAKFTKKNNFELGGENKEFKHSKSFGEITVFTNVEQEYIGDNYSPFENKGSFKATIRKGDLENIALESKDLANFNFQWGVDNWNTISKKLKQNNINKLELYSVGKQVKTFELRPLVNNQQQKGDYEFKNGGHLSKGKSLKQIAEMHNVSLAHINEELAKGLEVEKEHFSDFKERTRVAKDHLVENPNYYTILEKAGLKRGGHLQKQELVENSKKGDTPARDLNNYNDIMDLEADGMVGMESGLDFANGGITPYDANIEGDSVDIIESDFAKGGVVYDPKNPKIEKLTITRTGALSGSNRASVIGRYASTVSELQQIVSDYIGTSPQQEYDYIVFRVNDNTRGNYYIELNKGKKNTVKNVNPETLNSLNFKRVIDAKTYLVRNYDWTDFFELGSQTPTKTSNTSTSAKPFDLSNTKIWIGENNSEMSEKIQEKAFELGWKWANGQTVPNNIYENSLYFSANKRITYKSAVKDTLDFDNEPEKEIFPQDLGISVGATSSTSAKPYELNEVVVKWNNNKETYYSGKELIEALRNIERENNGQNVVYEVIGYDYNKSGGVPVEVETDDTSFVRRNYSDQDIKSKIDNWLDGFDTDKFFSVNQATASVPTSAKPFDFSMTKIDVSNNPDLSLRVQKKAFEDGWEWENGGGKTIDYNTFNYLYFTKTSVSYGNNPKSFINSPKREITEEDIFGSQTPTASIKKPKVERLYIENGASFSDIEKIRLYLDSTTIGNDEIYFYINPNGGGDYIRVEMKDSLSSMYYNRNAGLEPKYKKLREIFEYNRAFENYDWEEFFSNVVSSSTANVSNLAPYEASQVTLNWENPQGISQTANFYTEDGSGGSGKGFIYFLKEIEKNSNGKDVEVIIRAYAKDNDGKEIERATQFEIGENWFKPSERTNEQIKSIVENDWIDGITFEKFFEDVIPLSGSQTTNLPTLSKEDLKNTKIWIGDDVELRDKVIDKLNQLGISIDTSVGNKDYKKNVFIQIYFIDFVVWDGSKTEDFDKNRFKEIFPSDLGIGLPVYQAPTTQYKPIDLSQTKIWIGDDEEVNKQVQKRAIELGWSWKQYTSPKSVHFSYETALYFHSDKDISYGNDRQLFDSNKEFREIYFMDLFEKTQPDSSTQTPIISGSFGTVKEISDFKEAVGVLEGIASQVSKKYNTENYEESLQLLNEVKDDYSTALSLTPESAFMYERIEMTKKITEVQKEIKRITELKNGGAFYILSKVIERLEKGENWKELGIGEIMVNEVPEQEIDTVIYTEKFKNWFGDWEKALVTKEYDYVSKALTESGKPCVMYHGAKRIKYSYRQVSNGVLYLAENKSYAEWFSQNNSPYQKQGDYLTQCFVNLKNPIDLTVFGVEEVDLRDIIQYIDALYPLAKIYDVLEPPVLSLEIMNNNLIGLKVRAWNIIRQYPALNTHIRENTNYDGFIYYENNPSDKIFNEQTGQSEDKITKATAVFNSNQVKLVDAMLFDGSLDDWRFETGGKIN